MLGAMVAELILSNIQLLKAARVACHIMFDLSCDLPRFGSHSRSATFFGPCGQFTSERSRACQGGLAIARLPRLRLDARTSSLASLQC